MVALSVIFLSTLIVSLPARGWCAEVDINVDGSVSPPSSSEKQDDTAAMAILGSGSQSPTYGVDISWPMHRDTEFKDPVNMHLGLIPFRRSRHAAYRKFMLGCLMHYSRDICETNDRTRWELNLHQPPAMTNFTTLGYAKVQAPPQVFQMMVEQFDTFRDGMQIEHWAVGSTYLNHWADAPSYIHPLETHLSTSQRQMVERQVQDVLEAWTGVALVPTSLYGIRTYVKGSILAPHVDRLPLVISAIINVAQDDLEEPWPLEVIGHDGIAVNLTCEPGEMILYESASVIHGRPFRLKGNFYANAFLHYEPIGYSMNVTNSRRRKQEEKNAEQELLSTNIQPAEASVGASPASPSSSGVNSWKSFAQNLFAAALERQTPKPGTKTSQKMRRPSNSRAAAALNSPSKPPAVALATQPQAAPGLPPHYRHWDGDERRWRQEFTYNRRVDKQTRKISRTQGATTAHTLAANGLLERLKIVATSDPEIADRADVNGWKPIHEAARSGQTKILEYLIEEHGVDVNERTNSGAGASPLWWAKQFFPDDHPAVQLLRRHEAVALPPQGAR